MKKLTLLSMCFASFFAHAHLYNSKIPAKATEPAGYVDGVMGYQSFLSRGGLPNRRCVLVHGFGVSQVVLDKIKEFNGVKLKLPKELLQVIGNGGIPQIPQLLPGGLAPKLDQLVNATNALTYRLNGLADLDGVHAFGYFYFGEEFIAKLLNSACNSVIVVAQESNQSSLIEMTVRTERFLRDIGCLDQNRNPISCSLIGHGKGGAVVTSILRRCAEAKEPVQGDPITVTSSYLGPNICGSLREVISLAGSIEGQILPIILAGGRNLDKWQEEIQKSLIGKFLDVHKEFEEARLKLQGLEKTGVDLNVDFLGEKTPTTNPFWYGLSPIAEIDGEEGPVPLGIRHGPEFSLEKKGWLKDIQYSAAGGSYRFDEAQYIVEEEPETKIKKPRFDLENTEVKLTIGELQTDVERPRMISEDSLRRKPTERQSRILAIREKLDFVWSPFIESEKKADVLIQKMIVEAHGDPKAPMSFERGIKTLKEFLGKDHKTAFLDRYKLNPLSRPRAKDNSIYFHASDGLVEEQSALGVCRRSQNVEADKRIVANCQSFPTIHHLGLTGMAREVADYTVQELIRR